MDWPPVPTPAPVPTPGTAADASAVGYAAIGFIVVAVIAVVGFCYVCHARRQVERALMDGRGAMVVGIQPTQPLIVTPGQAMPSQYAQPPPLQQQQQQYYAPPSQPPHNPVVHAVPVATAVPSAPPMAVSQLGAAQHQSKNT